MNRGKRKGFYEDASNLSKEEIVKLLKENPDKYIELIEETAGCKLYWYQKILLKRVWKGIKYDLY